MCLGPKYAWDKVSEGPKWSWCQTGCEPNPTKESFTMNMTLLFFLFFSKYIYMFLKVLLINETSFYFENCHFVCANKRDVLQNGTRQYSRLYGIPLGIRNSWQHSYTLIIHYESALRPQRACFAHPNTHTYLTVIDQLQSKPTCTNNISKANKYGTRKCTTVKSRLLFCIKRLDFISRFDKENMEFICKFVFSVFMQR